MQSVIGVTTAGGCDCVFMHARVAVLTTAGVHAMLLTAQVVVDRKSVGIPLHGLGLTPAP